VKLLDGKRLLITGVVTTDSIAYATAAAAIDHGADVVLTSFERDRGRTVEAASHLAGSVDVLELDVTDSSHFAQLTADIRNLWGGLDGALHAVAFAPRSAVGLDFDASAAWPVYNWMGVCKAALESISRYVARDLGSRGIRSNLVAAGPLHTRAAGGIPDFDRLTSAWEARSPLSWDATDPEPVADAVCFLLSDLARAVTGEILHVDGGYHAIGA